MRELINWLYFAETQQGEKRLHRQCLLLAHNDAIHQAKQLVRQAPNTTSLCWLGEDAPDNATHVPVTEYRKLLGQEFDVAVYQAFTPFRPSALLALSGTLRSGGRLIIASPPLAEWPEHHSVLDTHFVSHGWELTHSRYLSHWIALASDDANVAIADNQAVRLPLVYGMPSVPPSDPRFATVDQQRTYDALVKSAGSAVITAPRGRGKSALLGELAVALLDSGKDILLTSNHYDSVLPLVDRLCASEMLTECTRGHFRHARQHASLQWVAPDNPELFSQHNKTVIIDEAASLPLPQLHTITAHSSRSILATTTDGYEGSGQGFIQRFIPDFLTQHRATHYQLSTPIRWLQEDPLERITSQGLLFWSKPGHDDNPTADNSIKWCDFSSMEASDIHSVMQLLVDAHYQTTPDDMMRLMDAPDIKLLVASKGSNVIGAVIINVEGTQRLGNVGTEISTGRRRVRGHMSAQRLALSLCNPEAASYIYWRVNRIAVSPQHQQKGYGSQMLERLVADAAHSGVDALTSSFGYTSSLKRFWENNGMEVVQHGVKKDKASGKASALVFRPVSEKASRLLPLLQEVRQQEEMAMAPEKLKDQNSQPRPTSANLVSLNITKLEQFVAGPRDTVQCLGSLHWLSTILAETPNTKKETLDSAHRFPLLEYLQNHTFNTRNLQHYGALASKSELKRTLQREVQEALTIYNR